MKALTIKPLWAHSIFHLGKDIENRNQLTKYRGAIIIHTSASQTKKEFASCCEFIHQIDSTLILPELKALPYGVLLGVVDLVDCEYSKQGDGEWGMAGYYHWRLENPRLIKPVPYKGQLGIWNCDTQIDY